MPCWTSLNLVAPIESVSYTSATDNQLSLLFRRRARGPYLFFVRPLYLDCLVDEQDSIEHNTTPHTLYRIKRREKIREKERESILPIHVGCLLLCPTSSDKKRIEKRGRAVSIPHFSLGNTRKLSAFVISIDSSRPYVNCFGRLNTCTVNKRRSAFAFDRMPRWGWYQTWKEMRDFLKFKLSAIA